MMQLKKKKKKEGDLHSATKIPHAAMKTLCLTTTGPAQPQYRTPKYTHPKKVLSKVDKSTNAKVNIYHFQLQRNY